MSLENEIAELRKELAALRQEIASLRGSIVPVPSPYPAYPYPYYPRPWWSGPITCGSGQAVGAGGEYMLVNASGTASTQQ